jgi:hypothetical protein
MPDEFRARLAPEDRDRLFGSLTRNVSLKAFARRAGMSYHALRFWQKGDRPIPSDSFGFLLEAAGLSVADVRYQRVPLRWQGRPVSLSEFHARARAHLEMMHSPESRKKARASLLTSHGNDHFVRLGLLTAERLPLLKREKLVLELNRNLPHETRVATHHTVGAKNFDFVYFRGDVLLAAEEVLGWHRKRDQFAFEYARITERGLLEGKLTLLTSYYEHETPRRTERFPLDLALWALEQERLLPVFLDVPEFRHAREEAIAGRSVDREPLREFCRRKLSRMRPLKGAQAELKTPYRPDERRVHDLLQAHGLQPAGKRLFGTRYGTYLVPDDYLPSLNAAVFVSQGRVRDVMGAAFALKTLCPLPIKAIGVIINPEKARQDRIISGSLDALVSLPELERLLRENKPILCLGR